MQEEGEEDEELDAGQVRGAGGNDGDAAGCQGG